MTCASVASDVVSRLFSAGRRGRLTLADVLRRPNGPIEAAHALGAYAVMLRKGAEETAANGGLILFDERWVTQVLTDIIRGARRAGAAEAPEVLRWVYRLARAPQLPRSEMLEAMRIFFGTPSVDTIRGTLFVWRWLDDWNLWDSVRHFEFRASGHSHVFDLALPGHGGNLLFELKNWHGISAANFGSFAGPQILADLAQDPLERTFWVFSDRVLQPPGPAAAGFNAWLERQIDDVVANAGSHRHIATIQANWNALKAQGVGSRVMIHDSQLAEALAATRDEFEEMFRALNDWRTVTGR